MPQLYHVYIEVKSNAWNSIVALGLTRKRLVQRLVDCYDEGRPITLSGRTIPLHDIKQLRISTSSQSVVQLLARAQAAERTSPVKVASAGGKEYLAFSYCNDVTDDFITGPPGRKHTPQGAQMASTNDFSKLDALLVDGQKIEAGVTDFYEADRQYETWVNAVGAEIAAVGLDAATTRQWINLATRHLTAARSRNDLQSLRSALHERLIWLGDRLSKLKAFRGTPHQMHQSKSNAAGPIAAPTSSTQMTPNNKKVFIVHGHDHGLRDKVARYIHTLGLEPIILQEQPSMGRTLIEKFEGNTDVGFAVVLATPDDLGESVKKLKGLNPTAAEASLKARARQNVIFELGYFVGKLGRGHTVLITEPSVELPSDLSGVVSMLPNEWTRKVVGELQAANYNVAPEQITRAIAID